MSTTIDKIEEQLAHENHPLREERREATARVGIVAYRLVLACFFLSGATGLIYEILWIRLLGLVFGNSVYAVTTAVCAFMAGLALGGYFLGQWVDRKPYPLLAYALLEILIGGTALLVPLAFEFLEMVYSQVYPSLSIYSWALNTYRFVSAFLTLVIPTLFMGGTLPVLSRFFVRSRGEVSKNVGWLYALNTMGATVGTVIAGFYLISHIGIRFSLGVTVTLNFLIGLAALQVHKRLLESGEPEESKPMKSEVHKIESIPPDMDCADEATPRRRRLFFVAFAMSGFVSLLYEIAWTRELALVIGSSVYAFSLILTVYLVGIALGSFMFSKFFAGERIQVAWFAWVELLIAGFAFLTVVLYPKSFLLLLILRRAFPHDFTSVVFVQLAVCFFLLCLPTLLFGATFPLVAKLCSDRVTNLGRSIGNLYSANTLGCIFGSFFTGFFLLPLLTARRTILLGVLLNVAVGLALILRDSWKRHRAGWLAATAFAVGVIFVWARNTFYDPYLQDAGVFIYADDFNNPNALPLEKQLHTDDLVFYRQGLNANISVRRWENYVGLRTNGKTDASTAGDMATQVMAGYLPTVFHPHPRQVFVIGFGSGSTVSSVAQLPTIHSIEVAEIEKAVMEAAPFFEEINRRVNRDPRFKLVLDDARNYLLHTREHYDVIISEPSNPWIAGIGNLYTREFYRAAATRLNEDGIMCQWVQIYQLDPESLKIVLRTFGDSFKFISLWRATPGDLLLLGSNRPIVFDLEPLKHWMNSVPNLRSDFSRYLQVEEPAGIFVSFLLPDEALRSFASGAPLNSDDLPLLEFRAPRAMLNGTLTLNTNLLEELRTGLIPPRVNHFSVPQDYLSMVDTMLNRERFNDASGLLKNLNSEFAQEVTHSQNTWSTKEEIGHLDLSRWALANARLAEAKRDDPGAERFYLEALHQAPGAANIRESYGVFLFKRGRFREAESLLKSVLALAPESDQALFFLAETESALGKQDEAIHLMQVNVDGQAQRDKKYQAYANLGIMYEKKGDFRNAEICFRRSIDLDRYSFVAHRRLAEIFRSQNRGAETIREYEFLVHYFPQRDEAVFVNLSKLYAEGGKVKEAHDLLEYGRSVFPNSTNIYHNYKILCGNKNT